MFPSVASMPTYSFINFWILQHFFLLSTTALSYSIHYCHSKGSLLLFILVLGLTGTEAIYSCTSVFMFNKFVYRGRVWISYHTVLLQTSREKEKMMELIENCMNSDSSGLHALQNMWENSNKIEFLPSRILQSNKTLLMTAAKMGHLHCCRFLLSVISPEINQRYCIGFWHIPRD